jgi:hypothetical protein
MSFFDDEEITRAARATTASFRRRVSRLLMFCILQYSARITGI